MIGEHTDYAAEYIHQNSQLSTGNIGNRVKLLIFLYSKRDIYLTTAGATIVCTTNEGLFARCRSFQTSTLRFVHRQSSGFSVIQHLRNMLSHFRDRKN